MHENVLNEIYEDWYFRDNIADSLPMAKYIAPKIVEYLGVESVLDVGCATGHWLSCYESAGLEINGIEGTTNSIPHCLVDESKVTIHDLRDPFDKTYNVDLVTSIEVAEHIEPEFADTYVDTLTKHNAQYIMMTAAPPGQGGHGHFNLQFKPYWIEKLQSKGYELFPEFEDKLYEWCKEGRETENAPIEFLRVCVEGDGTGQAPGSVRVNAANWETHEDAISASTDKLVCKAWGNVWIPFWFPKNVMTFRKA